MGFGISTIRFCAFNVVYIEACILWSGGAYLFWMHLFGLGATNLTVFFIWTFPLFVSPVINRGLRVDCSGGFEEAIFVNIFDL